MGGLRASGGAATPPSSSSNGLAEAIGARAFADVTIPRTTIRGRMRLLSRSERAQVRASTRAFLKLPNDANALLGPGMMEDWNAEVAIRTLAIVVRDPLDVDKPLDELDAWREVLDDDQIAKLNQDYQDLAERCDPLGPDAGGLTEGEHDALASALKKKDVDLLIGFGSRKLASFTLTLVEPPPS